MQNVGNSYSAHKQVTGPLQPGARCMASCAAARHQLLLAACLSQLPKLPSSSWAHLGGLWHAAGIPHLLGLYTPLNLLVYAGGIVPANLFPFCLLQGTCTPGSNASTSSWFTAPMDHGAGTSTAWFHSVRLHGCTPANSQAGCTAASKAPASKLKPGLKSSSAMLASGGAADCYVEHVGAGNPELAAEAA